MHEVVHGDGEHGGAVGWWRQGGRVVYDDAGCAVEVRFHGREDVDDAGGLREVCGEREVDVGGCEFGGARGDGDFVAERGEAGCDGGADARAGAEDEKDGCGGGGHGGGEQIGIYTSKQKVGSGVRIACEDVESNAVGLLYVLMSKNVVM